jgi:hypothetical protein
MGPAPCGKSIRLCLLEDVYANNGINCHNQEDDNKGVADWD